MLHLMKTFNKFLLQVMGQELQVLAVFLSHNHSSWVDDKLTFVVFSYQSNQSPCRKDSPFFLHLTKYRQTYSVTIKMYTPRKTKEEGKFDPNKFQHKFSLIEVLFFLSELFNCK